MSKNLYIFRRIPCYHAADYRILIIISLAILTAYNAASIGFSVVKQVLVAMVLAGVLDGAIIKARSKNWHFPTGAIISAMIIALLINPADVKNTVYVVIISFVLKHIISEDGRNIFNPAVLAVVVSSLFLPVSSSWWGSTGMITFVVGLLMVVMIKRWKLALSFLGVYLSLTSIHAMIAGTFTPTIWLVTGPAAFFAFFMVIEPVTTPKTDNASIIFGVGVAILTFIFGFSSYMIATSLFMYASLLLMNLLMRILPNHILE